MNNQRMVFLVGLADDALVQSGIRNKTSYSIIDSYNGQTSAFGVTVAMSGLVPALVMYYQEGSDRSKIDKRPILEAVALMIKGDTLFSESVCERGISNADSLLKFALSHAKNRDVMRAMTNEVIECTMALKQVIRTYKLIKDERKSS